MHVTYSSDHDWEKHTTFHIENLFGTNSENDDVNNCYTISTIHAPSSKNDDTIPPIFDDYGDENNNDSYFC